MDAQSIHASNYEYDDPHYEVLPATPALDESSLMEPEAAEADQTSFDIEFQIIEDSTKRGRNKLVDSCGFTYNVKRLRKMECCQSD